MVRRLPIRIVLFVTITLVGAAGCDDSSECVSGRTVACTCPGGGEGTQTCGESGAFEACRCPDAGPSADANPDDAEAADTPDLDPDTTTADTDEPEDTDGGDDSSTADTSPSDSGDGDADGGEGADGADGGESEFRCQPKTSGYVTHEQCRSLCRCR